MRRPAGGGSPARQDLPSRPLNTGAYRWMHGPSGGHRRVVGTSWPEVAGRSGPGRRNGRAATSSRPDRRRRAAPIRSRGSPSPAEIIDVQGPTRATTARSRRSWSRTTPVDVDLRAGGQSPARRQLPLVHADHVGMQVAGRLRATRQHGFGPVGVVPATGRSPSSPAADNGDVAESPHPRFRPPGPAVFADRNARRRRRPSRPRSPARATSLATTWTSATKRLRLRSRPALRCRQIVRHGWAGAAGTRPPSKSAAGPAGDARRPAPHPASRAAADQPRRGACRLDADDAGGWR